MNKTWRSCLAALLLLSPLIATADISLSFGVYSSDKPTAMAKQFQPILKQLETHMTESLGEPVSLRLDVSSSYEQGREKLIKGEVDISRFGAVSYVLTKEEAPGIGIAALETHDGQKFFDGVIAVHADSSLTSIEQLKGKRFAFGNQDSTIGRYLSQLHLMSNGIHARDLAAYDYLGRHDKVGAAVAAGQYDAGALKGNPFDKQVKSGTPLRRIISFPTPSKPWLVRSGMPGHITAALQQALLKFDDKQAFKALKCDGFTAGSDDDFEGIRTAIKRNDEFFQ